MSYAVDFDPALMAQIGRVPGMEQDARASASRTRAEFVYDYKIDVSAINSGLSYDECLHRKLFIKIATPTTRDVAYVPADDGHKYIYAAQYNAFMRKTAEEDNGTPLSGIRAFQGCIVDAYTLGIFTIEKLADHFGNDVLKQEGLAVYAKLAKLYLEKMNGCDAVLQSEKIKPVSKRGRPPKKAKDNGHNQTDYQPSAN